MSDSPAPEQPAERPAGHHPQSSLVKLAAGAVGIVFGDIGTSPIYAFRETFHGHHRLFGGDLEILGVLSLIFWSMMIVVTIKYVAVIMRADNKGEGGSLALLALINRKSESGKRKMDGRDHPARRVRLRPLLRRFDDHPGDFGPVRGRGPDHGRSRASPPMSFPPRSPSWSACSRSRRPARPGSAPCSARS